MEGTETLCPHATILNHRWLPGTLSRLLSGKPDQWMHLSPFYTRMHGEGLRYANSTSQYSLAFSLYRDDWGFQVNPLCRHDITSPFPPSGNEGYVRNRDVPPWTAALHWLRFRRHTGTRISTISLKSYYRERLNTLKLKCYFYMPILFLKCLSNKFKCM